MVNEAILKQWQEDPMDFIVTDALGIEKGTVMIISGNRTYTKSSGTLQPFAGILRREKVADNGRTRIAHFRKGFFGMVSCSDFGGTLQPGDLIMVSGVNTFCGITSHATGAAAAIQSGLALGKVLEQVTSTGQTVEVAVNA